MKALVRDLGLMEYRECWDLQQLLFDELLARKHRGPQQRVTPGAAPGAAQVGAAQAGAAQMGAAAGNAGGAVQMRVAEEKRVSAEVGTGIGDAGAAALKVAAEAKATLGAAQTEAQMEAEAREAARAVRETLGALPEAGVILTVEHPPVYTLGKSGHPENLLVPKAALEALGARFFHIDRGGDITFHGPGQLVCYPILDLERIGRGLKEYIDALEEAVIRTVRCFGIEAGRIAGASGVWLGEGVTPHGVGRPRKICAIGVRASRYVTMHGLALNVSTDLGWFSRINPCGFTDRGATSITAECRSEVRMEQVRELLVNFLSEILNVEIYK